MTVPMQRLRVALGWRWVKRFWHVPTDPRLDSCTCGKSWPCDKADRLRFPIKIDGGFDEFDYRRKIGIDLEFEARPKPSMLTLDINLWWRVLWASVSW